MILDTTRESLNKLEWSLNELYLDIMIIDTLLITMNRGSKYNYSKFYDSKSQIMIYSIS